MTVEEALVALLAAVAGILLFLGLAQALDSRPPRDARHRREDEARRRLPQVRPTSLVVASASETADVALPSGAPIEPALVSVPPPQAVEVVHTEAALEQVPVVPTAVDADVALVETCATLYLADKHAELFAAAEPEIAGSHGDESTPSSTAMTGLWSLVALSRRALGDDSQARLAADTALRGVGAGITEGCSPRLAALSLPIARRLLETAEQAPDGDGQRLVAPRLAMFWIRWRLIAAPGDHGAEVLLEAARDALAEGHADVATALIRRQEWTAALQLIAHGREADMLPAARADVLVEVLAVSLKHEIERLTAPMIRGAKNEGRALSGLERADAMLVSMAADTGLPPRAVLSMTRRLWRAYAMLGLRREQAGDLDGASEALFRALGTPHIGRARQRHVRVAVIRVLEAMGDQKLDAVTKLLAEDDRAAAAEQVEQLDRWLDRARDAGIRRKELAVAGAKASQLAKLLI